MYTIRNAHNIVFPNPTSDWGQVTHMGIFLMPSGGIDQLLWTISINYMDFIKDGKVYFPAESISIKVGEIEYQFAVEKFINSILFAGLITNELNEVKSKEYERAMILPCSDNIWETGWTVDFSGPLW